jgi:hypothetical protein
MADNSNAELMKAIVDAQLASNARMEKLEEFMMKLAVTKSEPPVESKPETSTAPQGIDLAKFRTSEGPVYKGPYHQMEPFLTWYSALKTFYRTKGDGRKGSYNLSWKLLRGAERSRVLRRRLQFVYQRYLEGIHHTTFRFRST